MATARTTPAQKPRRLHEQNFLKGHRGERVGKRFGTTNASIERLEVRLVCQQRASAKDATRASRTVRRGCLVAGVARDINAAGKYEIGANARDLYKFDSPVSNRGTPSGNERLEPSKWRPEKELVPLSK